MYVYYTVIKNESSEAVLANYVLYNLVNIHNVDGVGHIDVMAANERICLNNTYSKLRKPARTSARTKLPQQP